MSGYHRDGEAVARNTPVLIGGVDGSGNVQTLLLGTDGGMAVDLDAGDIEIGAVEIKDGASDQRATVDSGGGVLITRSRPATATLANVAGSASSVTLIASNAARRAATIVNESAAVLYVKFGSTASATSYTVQLGPTVGGNHAYYEVPDPAYTGIITGLWASATGSARVTEITA